MSGGEENGLKTDIFGEVFLGWLLIKTISMKDFPVIIRDSQDYYMLKSFQHNRAQWSMLRYIH